MKKLFLLPFLFLFYFSFGQTIPKKSGLVSDYENLFTLEQKDNITNILSEYEKETTIEILILTISEFESDIADFAQKTATDWKIGKEKLDNGLLIIISKNNNVLRSQTGYGLEGYLPDGWLKHTGDSIGIKYNDDYYNGILEFISQIKEKIGSEGYSEDVNKELIEKYKSEDNILSWMINNIPWYYWVGIIGGWFILLIIWPEGALWILYLVLSAGKSGGGSGGGKFGGGGSSSKW